MKKLGFTLLFTLGLLLGNMDATAQCSICSRTVEQLGEKPAKGLNAGILYLAFAPLAIIGVIGFRWWQRNRVNL
jgi:hypothetical protein